MHHDVQSFERDKRFRNGYESKIFLRYCSKISSFSYMQCLPHEVLRVNPDVFESCLAESPVQESYHFYSHTYSQTISLVVRLLTKIPKHFVEVLEGVVLPNSKRELLQRKCNHYIKGYSEFVCS